MKKLSLLLPTLLFISTLTFAQKGTVTGLLLDSANHKTTLNFATLSVFKGTDTILTTYKLSDDKGVFRIPNLEIGSKYRLVVNAWMYNILRKEFTISINEPILNLGSLFLSEKQNNLNEVTILSERPPIIVRKDTIEFNAESFKTLPTAVVEDLLKKLPGVTVASDGSIQVNGKAVSKILVDGKEFFGGDQQMATKNLPANIIDKISVANDPEAKRMDPDLTEGNIPQVINLKLKKAIKKGAFGKLYAGGGIPRERYEAGGIMNFFRDTTQISILAYGNNVNKPGFSISDVSRIGGFSRAGINSVMINTDGAFSLNDISFGGASSGVQKSEGAGANFNTLTKDGTKINGKYFFGAANTSIDQTTAVQQNIGANQLLSNTILNQRNKSYNHNFGARIESKFDSLTNFTFEPTVTLNILRNSSFQTNKSTNQSGQLLSNGYTNSLYKADNADFSLLTSLWKDFKKTGRSLNTSLSLSKKNNPNDNFNGSQITVYQPASISTIDQLRNTTVKTFNAYLSSNYNEPISKVLSLGISFSANYLDNENALATFYKNPLNQAYDIAVADASQTVTQTGYKTNTRSSIRWKATKDLNIQPGFVFNTIDLKNTFTSNPEINQHYLFFAPSLNVRYKQYNLSFSPTFKEPDVTYLQTVSNNTNPFFVQNGNPNLRPSKSYQLNLNVYKYDTKRALNYSINSNGSIQNDATVMSRVIDAGGVQTNTPINANGIWQLYAGANVSKDFKNLKTQLTIGGGFNTNYNRGLVLVNNVRSFTNNLRVSPNINARINLNDKFEFGQRYNLGINKSTYDDPFYSDINFLTHSGETDLVVRLPKKMVWETNYRFSYNTQTVNGMNNSIQIWNAALTLLFLKNDRAQLKFAINDILNTNTRRYITINENSIRDQLTNNLGRHGLVTLTYNIQNFGGKVGGNQNNFFRF